MLFDVEVNAYADNIRRLGVVVNMAIILGVDEGILVSKDRTLSDVLILVKTLKGLKLLGIIKLKLRNAQFPKKLPIFFCKIIFSCNIVYPSLVTQPPRPQRRSGTFAQYFDTTPGVLAKILASASHRLAIRCISLLPAPAVDAFHIEWN